MTTIQIPGIRDVRPEPSELASGLPRGVVTVKESARVQAARAGVPPIRLDALQDDDIVEIELEDGLRIWSRVEDLERDYGLARPRGALDDVVTVPSTLQIGGPSRGGADWAIKGLKLIGIDIAKAIGDFAAEHVEGRLRPGPGLYRCSEGSPDDLKPVDALTGSGPTLVFLHGTASSTAGSFGGLWTSAGSPVKDLFRYYEGRVLGLQHETLTKSPIENALALAKRLVALRGPGAELHLVSHSRGGLVGELMCRGMSVGTSPFTPEELGLFDTPGRERDRKALDELNATLEGAAFRVTRFVRVACPARGTTLADGRLDRYFSILVNLASLIPGFKGNPVYEGLTSLLAGVLKQRTKPEDLPGLEAMMPGSSLVRALNRPGARTAADLHVLGGDLAGTGVLGRLKTLATDLYYREDHDLVVHTPAMLGGTSRTTPVRYWIDTGNEVNHFNYFARGDTAGRLVAALTAVGADYRTLEAQPFAVTGKDYRKRAAVPQPVVFVLPGIMGSELATDEGSVWVDLFALAAGGIARLRVGGGNVAATGLVRNGYGPLCEFLSASHDVLPFPYDWRLPIDVSASRLFEAIEARVERAEAENQPIRLLAHSMGGLVVRAMLASPKGQQLWQRVCRHPGARFIMLGTPNRGSHAIPAMLIGRDALVKKLALIDVKHDYQGLLKTFIGFDGVLDLLPDGEFMDSAKWQAVFDNDVRADRGIFTSGVESSKSAGFAWSLPTGAALARAKRQRESVASTTLDPARVVYVAGAADETACDIVVDESAEPGRRVRVLASAHGDGRVLWSTGIPAGIRTYYMDVVHGDLANAPAHFPAVLDLLNTGSTSKLATTAPRRRSASDDRFEMREPMAPMIPDQDDLAASALGAGPRREASRDERPRVTVRVIHDTLKNATSPVLIGHYQQDVIVGAEQYLNNVLSGRLKELHRMELYPGPIATAAAVLNSDQGSDRGTHPGAIVAGLGTVGDLTPGALMTTLAHALTVYGAEAVGRERRTRQRSGLSDHVAPEIHLSISALLVGSGEGGLTLKDSVQALLRAVGHANTRLRASAQDPSGTKREDTGLTAIIDRVDILELYEDRAMEAVYALRSLARVAEMSSFVLEDLLVQGLEGRRRARYEMGQEWWQRIRVTRDGEGAEEGLKFEALTQQARVQALLRPTQRKVVEAFVQSAIGTTSGDTELGYTLFEMLVPHEFKSYAPDRRKLVLVLDEKAAALPWELLHDRYDRGSDPMSVASGMVRQLKLEGPVRARAPRAPGLTALVIGDPIVRDPRFPALPGAANEAAAVAQCLNTFGYDVRTLIGPAAQPLPVLSALHRQPWRILHLAAHGVFEFVSQDGAAPVSGMVLDDGIFLTPAEAEQMRVVPELVFINCCHLGQTAGEGRQPPAFHRLAANLGTQFIKMGARAVVAAGWAVDDRGATTFATTFYTEMFEGATFGEAVVRSREQVYAQFGATNTWGAYQCYGDPAFALAQGTARSRIEAPVGEFEVEIAAEEYALSAAEADAERTKKLLVELDNRVATVPAQWWRSAKLCAAVGAAYGELEQFDRALDYGARVLQAERATASVRALEQFANFSVRFAQRLGETDPKKAKEELGKAETLLQALLKTGSTAERYSLLGGVHKRRAILTRGDDRRKALKDMADAYAAAYDIAHMDSPRYAAYPLQNRLAAQIVLGWRPDEGGGKRKSTGNARAKAQPHAATALSHTHPTVEEGLTVLEALAGELAATSTDFFDLSAQGASLLLAALVRRSIGAEERQAIEQKFRTAGLRGTSPRNKSSLTDHIAFFEEMASTELPAPAGSTLKAELAELRQSLTM